MFKFLNFPIQKCELTEQEAINSWLGTISATIPARNQSSKDLQGSNLYRFPIIQIGKFIIQFKDKVNKNTLLEDIDYIHYTLSINYIIQYHLLIFINIIMF